MSARGFATTARRRVRDAPASAPPVGSIDDTAFAARRSPYPRVGFALAVLGAALVWTAALRLPLWRLDGPDAPFYIEVGHLWARGVPPYVGAFDVKPPGLFALVAVAESWLGASLDALRAVAIFSDAVAATNLFFSAVVSARRRSAFSPQSSTRSFPRSWRATTPIRRSPR